MVTVLMVCMNVVLATAGKVQGTEMWTSNDIGSVRTPGFARFNQEAMIWIVRGEGGDIWGPMDTFQYTSRPLKGDGFIIAKVDSISRTDPWTKCGVMIREDNDPGARFAAVYVTPENGVRFHARVNPADAVVCDTSVATDEQKGLRTPVWIKLERKGTRFYAYYATDKAGKVWTPMVWNPQTIPMSKAASAGLVACSHVAGTLCEAKFSGVAVSDAGYEITDDDVQASPQEALANAYQTLEQLGNWRDDKEILRKQGHLIASSLFAIARARELGGKPASDVLPDYYRIVELLPEARPTGQAMIRIAVLDGAKGLDYVTAHLEARPPEDKDRFYAVMMADPGAGLNTPEGEAVVKSFVKHVATSSRFTLLEEVITDLGSDDGGVSVCKSVIRFGMAEPSSVQTAIVALRYVVLIAHEGQSQTHLQELLQWAATQFKDTQLGPYALAALADIQYAQGSYDKVVETFQPGLFSLDQPDEKMVETVEKALAAYRTHTLLQATINPERLYKALAEKGEASGKHGLSLHCRRRIAEMKGLSLEDFEKSAQKGVKYCDSAPENEMWFWKGFISAGEGDLGAAAAAYERFLQGDGKSVLAARACYDVARTKMALGESAMEWVAKAKALCPCDAVVQLERRLSKTASSRG